MRARAGAAFMIVNPAAGGGRTRRLWPRLRDTLRGLGLRFEESATAERGAATDLARRAARDGFPLVVSVGGDGTLNEVINGLADDAGPAGPTLGAILTGRGRDAARNLGLAWDPVRAARRIVEGDEVTIDLGWAEWDGGRRAFVNAAGVGFDAAVAGRAARGGGAGTVPYLRAVLGALRGHRAVRATIHADDRLVWSGPMAMAVAANGAHYGGGMKIAPGANPADGALDVVVFGDVGRLELLWWLPTVYRGRHLANRKVTVRRERALVVRTDTPAPTHVDGEAAGTTPVRFSVRPQALRLRR